MPICYNHCLVYMLDKIDIHPISVNHKKRFIRALTVSIIIPALYFMLMYLLTVIFGKNSIFQSNILGMFVIRNTLIPISITILLLGFIIGFVSNVWYASFLSSLFLFIFFILQFSRGLDGIAIIVVPLFLLQIFIGGLLGVWIRLAFHFFTSPQIKSTDRG